MTYPPRAVSVTTAHCNAQPIRLCRAGCRSLHGSNDDVAVALKACTHTVTSQLESMVARLHLCRYKLMSLPISLSVPDRYDYECIHNLLAAGRVAAVRTSQHPTIRGSSWFQRQNKATDEQSISVHKIWGALPFWSKVVVVCRMF